MFKKLLLVFCASVCVAMVSHAQTQPCSTDEHYRKLLKQYPQLAEYEQQFETQLAARMANKTTSTSTIYDIPIVVHVIHDYGVENLSDDALYQAAAYWAIVYMEQNPDTADVIPPFIPYVGNPNIRLHLATIDPNGKPTKGIVRTQSYLANIGDDQAKYNQWPQNQYVNIWLIGTFGAEDVGVAAYALLPGTVPYEPYYDGIICLSSYTDPSTKTIPHEMGHVLNLQHPWGNTNNPGVACGDDHVDDTPPTIGHMPSGCTPAALYDTMCATGYNKVYMSVDGTLDSLVNYPDTANSQNIMDYTYCQKMFTKGQAARMRAALTSATAGRNNLITPANLAATGALAPMPDLPPVADYIVNRAVPATGFSEKRAYFLTINNATSFQFQNESWNDTVSDVLWTFSNGATNPTSTSMTTVNNQFSQTGWVTVSLVANSNAGSDTIINTHAVYVADTAVAGTLGYSQNFSSPAAVSNWPMFNYYNNQFQWQFYTGAGVGDNTCIRYHSFDTSNRLTGIAIGDHDDMYTPAFDLTGATSNVYFNFFYAGAYTNTGIGMYDPQQQDSLEIDASKDGGLIWTKIKGFNSTDLENNGGVAAEFVPTLPSQWVAETVTVPSTQLTNNTFFRFRFWPGNMGNDLYIDQFSISQYPAGVKEVVSATGTFNIFPNPATNGCNLLFKTGNTGVVNYCIKDITGKLVYQDKKEFAPNTIQQQEIPHSVTPVAGMYFVTLTVDGTNMTQKLVVY